MPLTRQCFRTETIGIRNPYPQQKSDYQTETPSSQSRPKQTSTPVRLIKLYHNALSLPFLLTETSPRSSSAKPGPSILIEPMEQHGQRAPLPGIQRAGAPGAANSQREEQGRGSDDDERQDGEAPPDMDVGLLGEGAARDGDGGEPAQRDRHRRRHVGHQHVEAAAARVLVVVPVEGGDDVRVEEGLAARDAHRQVHHHRVVRHRPVEGRGGPHGRAVREERREPAAHAEHGFDAHQVWLRVVVGTCEVDVVVLFAPFVSCVPDVDDCVVQLDVRDVLSQDAILDVGF